ncbi:hydroxyethylthiazole kinase, partial [Burkholderia humptydooensis]
MKSVNWNTPLVRDEFAAVKHAAPFVYGLTNYVAANLSANVLLAVGAAPAIGAAADWPVRFGAGAGALWINTAALMSSG